MLGTGTCYADTPFHISVTIASISIKKKKKKVLAVLGEGFTALFWSEGCVMPQIIIINDFLNENLYLVSAIQNHAVVAYLLSWNASLASIARLSCLYS